MSISVEILDDFFRSQPLSYFGVWPHESAGLPDIIRETFSSIQFHSRPLSLYANTTAVVNPTKPGPIIQRFAHIA
jgi:hypothetical protein